MTPAVSTFFVSPEFNDFLYAPIGAEENKMALSVLSALSRLNVDPWMEAAELSALPKDAAARRLASLIARLPGGRAQADCAAIANRLIELLPHSDRSNASEIPRALGLPLISHSTGLRILVCAALGLSVFLLVASNGPSSRNGDADRPAFDTRLPSQVQ
jgi:broad specificity phosphatase PhoE